MITSFSKITIDFQNKAMGSDNNCFPLWVFIELEEENGPPSSTVLL